MTFFVVLFIINPQRFRLYGIGYILLYQIITPISFVYGKGLYTLSAVLNMSENRDFCCIHVSILLLYIYVKELYTSKNV